MPPTKSICNNSCPTVASRIKKYCRHSKREREKERIMASSSTPTTAPPERLLEVIPKSGLVYSEKSTMVEVLCKPKLMAIKSASLIRLEELEKQAAVVMSSTANNTEEVASTRLTGAPSKRL